MQSNEPTRDVRALEIGDVVRLKCGGQTLVIENAGKEEVTAIWLTPTGELRRENFRRPVLVLVEQRTPAASSIRMPGSR